MWPVLIQKNLVPKFKITLYINFERTHNLTALLYSKLHYLTISIKDIYSLVHQSKVALNISLKITVAESFYVYLSIQLVSLCDIYTKGVSCFHVFSFCSHLQHQLFQVFSFYDIFKASYFSYSDLGNVFNLFFLIVLWSLFHNFQYCAPITP